MKNTTYKALLLFLFCLGAFKITAQPSGDAPKRIPVEVWTNSEIMGAFVATPVIDKKVYFTRLLDADFVSSPIITNLTMQLPTIDALEAAAVAKKEVAATFGSAAGWRVTGCSLHPYEARQTVCYLVEFAKPRKHASEDGKKNDIVVIYVTPTGKASKIRIYDKEVYDKLQKAEAG